MLGQNTESKQVNLFNRQTDIYYMRAMTVRHPIYDELPYNVASWKD